MSDSTRHGYDAVASEYAAELSAELTGKPLDRGLLNTFAELVEGGLVADVGCGPGHIGEYLAGRGVQAIGLDLSLQMCATGARLTALSFAAADMTALPLKTAALSGIVCFYAVIHLDPAGRQRAYAEFARAVRPGGHVLLAFHVRDAETPSGSSKRVSEFFAHDVELTFHFLDPDEESADLSAAGFDGIARLDRAPIEGAEHPSDRCYLLARRR